MHSTHHLASRRPGDLNKVRTAISLKRVDPADIPASARVTVQSRTVATPASAQIQGKRTAAQAGLDRPSQIARPSLPSSSISAPSQDDPEDDVLEELYCTMNTNVVGIQYYRGICLSAISEFHDN